MDGTSDDDTQLALVADRIMTKQQEVQSLVRV
jgi:hypothetical protein